jgi:hypothetical protein
MFRPSSPAQPSLQVLPELVRHADGGSRIRAEPNRGKIMSKTTAATKPFTDVRFDAFTVRDYEIAGEKRSDWTRIGVAFPHQDSKGYRIVLNALPVGGVVMLRLYEAKEHDTE